MKYLKYFISPATIIAALFCISNGAHYPTAFLIGFSLFIILGDLFVNQNHSEEIFKYPFLLNLPIYINLPLLSVFIYLSIFSLTKESSSLFWFWYPPTT